MKNKWLILAGAVALTAFSTAQATPITGQVTFNGLVELGNAGGTQVFLVEQAAQVLAWSSSVPQAGNLPYVSSSSGSLGASALTPVTFATPWGFGVQANLWSYTASDGDIFSFSLNAITVNTLNGSPGSETLSIIGTGLITEVSGPVTFSATAGTWTFTTSDPSAGGTFSIQAATGAIPDGGMTVMLLGAALSGMGLLRKKLIA
jgi:hypothetical protein